MEAALRLDCVSVRHEEWLPEVLSEVSLELLPGEKVALIGLNGSGKTTLLQAVAGLLPARGEILVGPVLVRHGNLSPVRERVGVLFNVPEDQLLFPRVLDDVTFGLRQRGLSREEAAERARSVMTALRVNHLEDMPVHRLSHGQKQRVALAGALVTEPPLLLLDEPSAGLDPPGKKALAGHLAALTAAMLVATHDLPFAASFCSRYVLLEDGRVRESRGDLAPGRDIWSADIWPECPG